MEESTSKKYSGISKLWAISYMIKHSIPSTICGLIIWMRNVSLNIDELVQERHNSSALANVFLALTHWYGHIFPIWSIGWAIYLTSVFKQGCELLICLNLYSTSAIVLTHWGLNKILQTTLHHLYKNVWNFINMSSAHVPDDVNDNTLTLVQVITCCLKAPCHYLNKIWQSFIMPYGTTRPKRV